MANYITAQAMTSGLRLIWRAPLVTLAWGLAAAAFVALFTALTSPFAIGLIHAQLQEQDLARHPRFLGGLSEIGNLFVGPIMIGVMAVSALFLWILWVPVSAAFECAIYRRVAPTMLSPHKRLVAVIKLAALRTALALAAVITLSLWSFATAMFATFFLHGQGVASNLVSSVALCLAVLALVWQGLRLSLLGPMVATDGRFHLIAAWRATRGHDLELLRLGCALVAISVTMAAMAVLAIFATTVWGLVAIGGVSRAVALLDSPGRLWAMLAPQLSVDAAVMTCLAGPALVAMTAPWARAYADLAGERSAHPARG